METVILVVGVVVFSLVLLVAILSAIAPTRIAYTEEIMVNAPVENVYDDLRIQDRLMRWSAWPKETKSTCAVDVSATQAGEDGAIGARTVFSQKASALGIRRLWRSKNTTALPWFWRALAHRTARVSFFI